jgi:hypothetical protein
MSDNLPIKGHIYLLKMCDTKHNIIYKVGKSINFYKRFKKYNFAEILTFIVSYDITKDENEIIRLFNINCKLDTGREFFLAKDDNFVLKIFMDYFSNKINRSIETSNSNSITNITSVSNLVDEPVVTEPILIEPVVIEPVVIEPVVTEPIVIEPVVTEPIVTEPIVIEPVVESSNTIESIENNKILERTCPTCKKEFNFASRLKSHLESTIHCKKTDAEITTFFKKFEKISNFNCDICNHKYTKKQNLQRHIEHSTCKKFIEQKKLLNELETIKLKISNLSINN